MCLVHPNGQPDYGIDKKKKSVLGPFPEFFVADGPGQSHPKDCAEAGVEECHTSDSRIGTPVATCLAPGMI